MDTTHGRISRSGFIGCLDAAGYLRTNRASCRETYIRSYLAKNVIQFHRKTTNAWLGFKEYENPYRSVLDPAHPKLTTRISQKLMQRCIDVFMDYMFSSYRQVKVALYQDNTNKIVNDGIKGLLGISLIDYIPCHTLDFSLTIGYVRYMINTIFSPESLKTFETNERAFRKFFKETLELYLKGGESFPAITPKVKVFELDKDHSTDYIMPLDMTRFVYGHRHNIPVMVTDLLYVLGNNKGILLRNDIQYFNTNHPSDIKYVPPIQYPLTDGPLKQIPNTAKYTDYLSTHGATSVEALKGVVPEAVKIISHVVAEFVGLKNNGNILECIRTHTAGFGGSPKEEDSIRQHVRKLFMAAIKHNSFDNMNQTTAGIMAHFGFVPNVRYAVFNQPDETSKSIKAVINYLRGLIGYLYTRNYVRQFYCSNEKRRLSGRIFGDHPRT